MERLKRSLEEISSKKQPKVTVTESILENSGITDLKLRDYQLDGVQWLVERYKRGHGCILGDEMGLGKTCQTISYLVYLNGVEEVEEPHLILCPLSVLDNWKSEFSRFAPGIKLLIYTGDKDARSTMRRDIRAQQKTCKYKFDVLLTTYEMCLKDEEFLRGVLWHVLVIDEGHRVKNSQSMLHKALVEFDIEQRLLLTGTPIQNDLNELYALLGFVAPEIFHQRFREIFVETFSDVTKKRTNQKADITNELHKLLEPFLLRRIKDEVVKDLPSKSEVVLFHGISALQKKYYKAILLKDTDAFDTNRVVMTSRTRLLNILMQLRKCVNHPYLFDGVEPEPFEMGEHLVTASDKLVVIDRLLTHLRRHGHRVLLFSQMTRMLDILQDYLHYKGYSYERLDGSVRGEERFIAVKQFQQNKETFVFLLSTKAGGQGLNLTAADTVIFVDSDFNPQNDLQAAARAHRIGQTKPVKIIRLVGRSTVDEIILHRAERKLHLTHAVIEGGQFSHLNGKDARDKLLDDEGCKLQDILKFGVDKLFENEDGYKVDLDLETILGPSDDGKWRNDVTVKDAPQVETVTPAPSAEETKTNMYVFEGTDYSTQPSGDDVTKFDALMAAELAALTTGAGDGDNDRDRSSRRDRGLRMNRSEMTPMLQLPEPLRKARMKLMPEQLDERRRKTKERKEQKEKEEAEEEVRRAQEKKRRREKLWQDNEYTSLNAPLESESESEERSEDLDIDQDEDINYLKGDVTHPVTNQGEDAIIVHCVDDSGWWGTGGLFSALNARSLNPEKSYIEAGNNKDLALGDAHIFTIDDLQSRPTGTDMCALVVAQHRDKKNNVLSGIKLPALEQALLRIYKVAKTKKASVHLPRIGYNTPSFNWYGTERLIRRILATRGVPTYIYYYDRNRGSKRTSSQVAESIGTDKSRKLVDQSEASSSHNYSTTSRTSHDVAVKDVTSENDDVTGEGDSFLDGLKIHFYNVDSDKRRQLVKSVMKLDGDVHRTIADSTTHIVCGNLTDDEKTALSNLCSDYEDVIAVSVDWLDTSLNHQRLESTKKWLLDTT